MQSFVDYGKDFDFKDCTKKPLTVVYLFFSFIFISWRLITIL